MTLAGKTGTTYRLDTSPKLAISTHQKIITPKTYASSSPKVTAQGMSLATSTRAT